MRKIRNLVPLLSHHSLRITDSLNSYVNGCGNGSWCNVI